MGSNPSQSILDLNAVVMELVDRQSSNLCESNLVRVQVSPTVELCGCGVTGSLIRLKIGWIRPCGFESHQPY